MSYDDTPHPHPLPPSALLPDAVASDKAKALPPELRGGYYAISTALRGAAKRDAAHDWTTLSEIMGFQFTPGNVAEPFHPKAIFGDRRSMIPDDLTDAQLDRLSEYVTNLDDDLVVARAGDVLWLRQRDVKAARRTVEAYLAAGIASEDPNHWTTCFALYERGVRLARQIEPKGELPRRLLGYLEGRVRHYDGDDPLYLSLKIMDLLEEVRFGDFAALAEIAGRIASKSEEAGDFRRAQEYYATQARLLKRAGDRDAAEAALCARAQTFVSEAEDQEKAGSFIAAHKFWEDSVQAFQARPSLRARLPDLRRRLAEAGRGVLGEMKRVQSDSVDLTEQVDAVQALFRGLPRQDAIFRLALIDELIDPVKLREQTLATLKDSPLQTIIRADVFDQAGRKIAVRPALGSGDSKVEEAAIDGFMDQNARFHRHFAVHAALAPAVRVMRDEHDLGQEEIAVVIADSHFIPTGRLGLFARGLEAGFKFDSSTALHLLIPQAENSLRHLLEGEGIVARNINTDGVEEVWGVERILDHPKATDVLGAECVYELRTLLAGRLGPNPRNVVAHGLVDEDHLNGQIGFYLWWVILRLVVVGSPQLAAFIARLNAAGSSEEAEAEV
ncbi:DUF4209 domain-containing protein [Methylobacterium symbioticum]